MTLPRLAAMNVFWNEHPPAHILIAAYVGYKPPTPPKRATRAGLRAMFG
jgi:hypothetical protein